MFLQTTLYGSSVPQGFAWRRPTIQGIPGVIVRSSEELELRRNAGRTVREILTVVTGFTTEVRGVAGLLNLIISFFIIVIQLQRSGTGGAPILASLKRKSQRKFREKQNRSIMGLSLLDL